MYIAMFILEPGKRDEEFEKLNALIEEAAHATEGCKTAVTTQV